MKFHLNERNTSVNLALTGLMAALVLVATMFFKVQIPVGTDKTMIGFANVFLHFSRPVVGAGVWRPCGWHWFLHF